MNYNNYTDLEISGEHNFVLDPSNKILVKRYLRQNYYLN